MKRFLLLFSTSICIASCTNKSTSAVTVIDKSTTTFAKARALLGLKMYKAVTISGDTLDVEVPEDIALNCKLPYKARMVKAADERFGHIKHAIGTNH